MSSSDYDYFTSNEVSIDDFSKDEVEAIAQASIKLLDLWCINDAQKIALLGLKSTEELKVFESTPLKLQLNSEHLTRLSMIINIHQSLRLCFANPENCYGFMTMRNENLPFSGLSPIDLATKSLDDLVQTYSAIVGLSRGNW